MDTYLSALVVVLGACALLLAGSTKGEKFRTGGGRKRTPEQPASSAKKEAGSSRLPGEVSKDAQELKQSGLAVPPPDHKRIEAIAPKNDGPKMPKQGRAGRWL